MSLQKRLEAGRLLLYPQHQYDAVRRSLTVVFMKAPEEDSLAKRILIFEDIEHYTEVRDGDTAINDAADGIIDSLIALCEFPHGSKLKYELVTELRVLNFETRSKPRIEDA